MHTTPTPEELQRIDQRFCAAHEREVLTQIQKRIYFEILFSVLMDESPTIRELKDRLDYRSPAPIQNGLNYLRHKGYISSNEGVKARSIEIIGLPSKIELVRQVLKVESYGHVFVRDVDPDKTSNLVLLA